MTHGRAAAANKGLLKLSEPGGELPHGEALRQRQQIGLATSLLAHRLAITPERGWTAAWDKADENSGAANSKLGIVKDQLWPVIRGLTC